MTGVDWQQAKLAREISAEDIRKLLTSSSMGESGGSDWQSVVRGPLASQDNSRVFYVECSRYSTPVAVKCCLKSGTLVVDSIDAGRQFDGLQRVFEKMGGARDFSVPAPHEFYADEGIYVTEWISGKSMTDELFSRGCTQEHALDLMTRAAQWLCRFHGAHRLPPGSLDVEEKLAAITELAILSAPKARDFRRGIDTLKSSASAAARIQLNRSWVHGDFKADNLIVSGERVVGIDIYVRHENTVIHDLAPFMNHIALSFCGPGRWRSSVGRDVLLDSFLQSYLGTASGMLALPLTWLRLHMMLYRWSYLYGHATKFRSIVLRLCIQRCVRQLSSELRAYC